VRFLGEWADILRIIGRLLDAQGARDAEITNADPLRVRWQSCSGVEESTSYTELDINQLRAQAPLMRRPVALPPRGETEELLRTLGQELDAQGIKVEEIVERGGGYHVTGSVDHEPVFRFYAKSELRTLSERRRAVRKSQPTLKVNA